MNIRKIILEEINDFDWIEGIKTPTVDELPNYYYFMYPKHMSSPQNKYYITGIYRNRFKYQFDGMETGGGYTYLINDLINLIHDGTYELYTNDGTYVKEVTI